MNNKELYSYIVGSLDIMNKSLIMNEQNTVKLFSYLYNNYVDLNNKFAYLETNINKQIIDLEINFKKQNSSISKEISLLKKYQKKYEDKISLIENKKTKTRIIIDKIKYNINIFLIKIKNIFDICYNHIYNIIFYKKIQKEKEKELKLAEEEKIQKDKEYKEIIKNILKK